MARDYKNAGRRRRPAPKRGLPGWVWLLVGLFIGLSVALAVYLEGGGRKGPSQAPAAPPRPAPVAPEPRKEPQKEARDVRKRPEEPVPPPPKPRFDFYTLLPEQEVVIPEKEISGKPKQGVPQVEKPGTYLLQAGAFRKLEDADRLKASLALLGIQSNIHATTINKEQWYRVRIGPYTNLNELNAVRLRLREHAIDALLVKINP